MLFNSIPFALFLPLVFILYWLLQKKQLTVQNSFILAASYFFYAWMDWRFLALIFAGSLADYIVGILIAKQKDAGRQKILLGMSIAVNLGLLGFFKYYDFFLVSFADLINCFGVTVSIRTLGVIVPTGISFYTFKKLSYTIDIYRGSMKPTRNAVAFFAYVAFFPEILAGPIDRASTLLPQFLKKRNFSQPVARDGLRQMLSGFLKKMIIADNLAPFVNDFFSNYNQYDGLSLAVGIFFTAMQLYCDFSGYSDIAIGCAKLFGFNLMRNFAFPYFSRDIAEFWRRWHISLSTWLRDYVYVPFCGDRPSKKKKALGITLTFTLCGFWHDANWTYIVWGFIHGLLFLPMTLAKRHPRYIGTPAAGRLVPRYKELKAMALTFASTSIAWVFFQSSSVSDALGYLTQIITNPYSSMQYSRYLPLLLASVALLSLEWIQREKQHFMDIGGLPVVARWTIYYSGVLLLLVFGAFGSNQFLYSQF